MKRFEGKVVLVTGGNRNTGLDIVEKFACEGAKVFMCGSSEASTAKGAEWLICRCLYQNGSSGRLEPGACARARG